jgi:DNA-binding protein HU-beta
MPSVHREKSERALSGEVSPEGKLVNKSQLVEKLAERFEGNRKQAAHALESVLDTITREVAKGEKVAITGFGSFEKRVREARWVRNPQTGARIKAKKTSVPKFNPGQDLKNVVSGAKKLPKLTLAAGGEAAKKATAPAKKAAAAAKNAAPTRNSAAKKTSTAKKSTAKKSAPAKKSAAKKTSTAKKSTAKKSAPAKKSAAKKTSTAKKSTAKKSAPAKKTAAKKTGTAKTTAAKKAPAKKSTAKKSTAKKTAKKS